MSKETKKLAVAYYRVSTDRQAEDGTSLDVQAERCQAYADKEGYQILKVFREEGESAKAANRPKLLEMLSYLAKNKGKISALIIFKLDRLSRSTNDQSAIMYKLQQAEVELRSATENIDESAVGNFMRSVLWAVAQFDNEIRGERTRSGQYKRFKDGYWPFAPASGYIMGKEEGTGRAIPIPHPEYGKLITWAAKQRAAGVSYGVIAKGLKQRGFKTRQGNVPSLYGQSVYKMLHNTFYYGLMQAFGEQEKGRYQPLISYDVWLQMRVVDGEVSNPASQRQKYNPKFPLQIKCPECGRKITGSFSTGKLGVKYPYYHHYKKYDCKLARNFNGNIAHENFVAMLNELKPLKEHLALYREIVLRVAKEKSQEREKEISLFASQLKIIEKQKQQLLDFKITDPNDEAMSREDFLSRKQVLEENIRNIEHERAKHDESAHDLSKLLDRCFALITDPAKRWLKYKKIENKVEFQRMFFPQGIEYDGQKFGTPEITPAVASISGFSKSGGDENKLVGHVVQNWNPLVRSMERMWQFQNRVKESALA